VIVVGATNEEYIMQIINSLKRIDYIKPDEIPNIDLYMDQVTTFMDKHLKASKRYDDDKMLTKTMINNYTKNNLLPSPNKKKYSKEHMLLLVFIYYFKNILSISDIQSIFTPLTTNFFDKKSKISLEEIYEEVFHLEKEQVDSLTKDVIRKFSRSRETFSDVKSEEERDFLTTFSFICMLSFDVYIKKVIIEKLIDKSLNVSGSHSTKKPEKATEKKAEKKPEKTTESI
jgi:hypothetical protein